MNGATAEMRNYDTSRAPTAGRLVLLAEGYCHQPLIVILSAAKDPCSLYREAKDPSLRSG